MLSPPSTSGSYLSIDKWYNVPAITYGIRHGDSTWWQGMRQDLMYPKWYQPLHYPPSPWNWVVPHHWCLRPLLFQRTAVWVLLRPKIITTMKSSEMDTMVCHPYPRRLECLTICRCHNKGSTFYSVILRPCVLVRLVCTRDLPLGRPVLIHLNLAGSGIKSLVTVRSGMKYLDCNAAVKVSQKMI